MPRKNLHGFCAVYGSSTYYFEVTMHQIFADLCPFESFCKLFAACCLEVIVCKFYYIIGIFFANN